MHSVAFEEQIPLLAALTGLTSLRLDWCQLPTLAGELSTLTRLNVLDLHGNELTQVPIVCYAWMRFTCPSLVHMN